MKEQRHDLTALIAVQLRPAGHGRPVKEAAARTVGDPLLGLLCKKAARIVTNNVLPKGYVAPAEIKRRQQAQAAEAARQRERYGFTGNKAYDALPGQAEYRAKLRADRAQEEFFAKAPIVQKKDMATIKREADAMPDFYFGDTALGKSIGAALSSPFEALGGYGPDEKTHSDVANNLQIFWNNTRRGAGSVGRAIALYGDPRNWGSSTRARLNRRSQQNEWDNATMAYMERDNRLTDHFKAEELRHPESNTLGLVNYGLNAVGGQFSGGELATAGAGLAASAAGKGIDAGTHAISGAIRPAAEASTTLGRAGNMARTALANGVDAMGHTLSYVPRTLGQMQDPTRGAANGVRAGARFVWDTGKGAMRPVRDAWRFARDPHMLSRYYHAVGPWRFAGDTAMYPLRWVGGTLRPAWGAISSPGGLQAQAMYGAMDNMRNGNYGAAAGEIGTMGMFGALGNWALPAILAQSMYHGGAQAEG